MRKAIRIAALTAVVGGAVVGMNPMLGGAFTSHAEAAVVAQVVRLQGGGASFPKAIYQRWASDFGSKHSGMSVEYNSQGSGFGIAGITNKTLDFAGSDAPMNKAERDKAPAEVLHIPSVAGAVVMAYNLPGVSGEIKLTGEIVADIYMGKIAKWNDSRITSINPGVNLPDLAITPVYRSDSSGTTFVFTNYLATQSREFIKASPPGKNITITGGQAGKGNEGVSNTVTKIPGAIGYIELTYAINEKIPHASLQNRSGKFVKASVGAVSVAGEDAENLTANIWNSKAENAYPIAAFTYMLVYKDLSYTNDKAKAKAIVDFLKFCLTDGQGVAPDLAYAPLPDAMKQKALAALKEITFEGKPVLE